MGANKDKPLTFEEQRVRQWIVENPGILTQIAVECQCSHQFVQQYAYGHSSANPGHKIERVLYEKGWPGISGQKDPRR